MDGVELAYLSSGLFFIAGLLTGSWKYRRMITSSDGRSPTYVDICHRAALLYAFACILLAQFARMSAWDDSVDLWAVAVPVAFFASAVVKYALHGLLDDTDNQFRRPHMVGGRRVRGPVVTAYMYALTAGELGGFLVLFSGFLRSLHSGAIA